MLQVDEWNHATPKSSSNGSCSTQAHCFYAPVRALQEQSYGLVTSVFLRCHLSEVMHNYNLLPSLKPGSSKSPQLHLVSWSYQPSHGFPGPDSCAQGLEGWLAVPINHRFPLCPAISVMGFHSLSIWLVAHSTEQTSEPGDPEASGSAIQCNTLPLNVFRRGIPCAAALSRATIPTDGQDWLAKMSSLVQQLTEGFSAKEQRSGTEKSRSLQQHVGAQKDQLGLGCQASQLIRNKSLLLSLFVSCSK